MATTRSTSSKTRTKVTPPKKVTRTAPAAPAKKGFPARKPGSAPARKRKPLPTYKAPADFKPHFILVQVATERDGLLGSKIKAVRYQGRFDREADDKKKFDMSAYDWPTIVGIQSRLSALVYKTTNDKKYDTVPKKREGVKGAHRLPASTIFQLLIRVGRKSADNTLTARVGTVFQIVELASGRKAPKELTKTDPAARMFKRVNRFLPAAFINVQMPPKRTRGRKVESEDDEG